MQLPGGARLAVDLGQSRTGVARSVAGLSMAMPVQTLKTGDDTAREIAELADEYGVSLIYLGMPKLMSGRYGSAAKMVMEFARELQKLVGEVQIALVDERLTTVSATKKLQAGGIKAREGRKVIDQQAAVEILEQALEIESKQNQIAGTLLH